ncbi:Dynactin subunit 2 [Homalodisca vitripennis]|nr:Dynactin subunit 2 [Homalodisca vitripennis]
MADPKYANLIGIAYDQPDIYETKDLPEADQNAEIFEEESDSIERLHISASTALSKFKGKTLDSANVDFSDRLSRRIRTGYSARFVQSYFKLRFHFILFAGEVHDKLPGYLKLLKFKSWIQPV